MEDAQVRNATGLLRMRTYFEAEHDIYREDAVLDIRDWASASAAVATSCCRVPRSRAANASHRWMISAGELWIAEYVPSYDERRASWRSWTGRRPARPSISETRSSRVLHARNGSNECPETWSR